MDECCCSGEKVKWKGSDFENILFVFFGAGFGVLFRFGLVHWLEWMITKEAIDTGMLFEAFFPNVLGCFWMGVISFYKRSYFFSKYPGVYTGIGTGLLGSLTTYSGWQVHSAFKASIYHNYFACCMSLLFGFCVPALAFKCGEHFGKFIRYCFSFERETLNDNIVVGMSHGFMILLLVVNILLMAFLISFNFFEINELALACIAGPYGAMTRYILGKYNATTPNFPFFTFIANFLGAILYVVMYYVTASLNSNVQTILRSLILTGFCGCLTTVSTWIGEIHKLSDKNSYIYTVVTVLSTQAVVLPITFIVENVK
eukprot:TRINITY_DN4006_c0_g1_i1.p1 TRINITY_DN4006_c0_g1~~TRINITY_DN4006_c0_g1_i1.p1  ORF type:complete len:314 (-),score=38.49 TRINITY_DN4006_c0_g1_i1:1241-2182(-)